RPQLFDVSSENGVRTLRDVWIVLKCFDVSGLVFHASPETSHMLLHPLQLKERRHTQPPELLGSVTPRLVIAVPLSFRESIPYLSCCRKSTILLSSSVTPVTQSQKDWSTYDRLAGRYKAVRAHLHDASAGREGVRRRRNRTYRHIWLCLAQPSFRPAFALFHNLGECHVRDHGAGRGDREAQFLRPRVWNGLGG